MAARLAATGYEGPETVLEGKFGFLDAFGLADMCEAELLTKGLGSEWEVRRICLKRYAAHINAHTPVQALRELMVEHKFAAADVAHLLIEGSERLLTHHNIPEPVDILKAQYSVPFCVAIALHRDPDDPRSFDESAVKDPAIRATEGSVASPLKALPRRIIPNPATAAANRRSSEAFSSAPPRSDRGTSSSWLVSPSEIGRAHV